MSTNLSRRSFLTGVGAAAGAGFAESLFVPSASAAETTDTEWTGYSICDSCNHMPMCGVKYDVRGNTVIRIHNWGEHPNHFLCSKGLSTLQRLYNPNRLLYPMKRTNPKGSKDPGWVRIGWDEAIRTIAENLTRIKEKDGADKVLFYCGDPKEPRPPVMRLARYFGSPNYACESSAACNLAYVHALELTWGWEIAGGPSPKTKCLMIVGKNGSWSSPHGFFKGLLAQKARGMKLIVVDPRRTKVAEQADIHLQLRPGTDGALAWGMIRVLVKEGLVNKPFVDKWCSGYEEVVKYCETFTPEYVEKETGVKAELVVEAARMFADGPSGMMLPGQSIPHQHNGCNNVRAMSLLMALTGWVDVPGASSFANWPEDYIRWDEGYTRSFIDQKWFNQPENKKIRIDREFAPVWNEMQVLCSPNMLPEMVKAGRIKAFCGWGANLLIWPSPAEYQEAVRNLEFSFATDYFYRDETHHDMDLVLPRRDEFRASCAVRRPRSCRLRAHPGKAPRRSVGRLEDRAHDRVGSLRRRALLRRRPREGVRLDSQRLGDELCRAAKDASRREGLRMVPASADGKVREGHPALRRKARFPHPDGQDRARLDRAGQTRLPGPSRVRPRAAARREMAFEACERHAPRLHHAFEDPFGPALPS